METTRHSQMKVAEEMEAVKRENEELKEVLSAVQLDLEAKTEVGRGRVRGSWTWRLKLRWEEGGSGEVGPGG